MASSKVILNGTTLMDVTSDTVTTDKLLLNYTAHDAGGEAIVGTATAWTEITITTAATNTADCINILFPDRQPYHYYVAQLVKKSRDNYATNQLIQYTCATDSSQNAATGGGTRWRNNAFSSYASVGSSYDAVVEVGDTFLVSQTAYTISDT